MPSPTTAEAPSRNPTSNGDDTHPVISNGVFNSEGHGGANGVDTDSNGANGVNQKPPLEKPPAHDVIQDGKEKAKAVMVASGIAKVDTTSTPDRGVDERHSPAGSQERLTNGRELSRKRSRSGTRITHPPSKPASNIPLRTKESAHKVLLEQMVQRELCHSAAMHVDNAEFLKLIGAKRDENNHYKDLEPERHRNPGAIFGYGYAGYGNGNTNAATRGPKIVVPSQRKRPAGRRSGELHITRKELATQAEQLDELVPVRLDIEWDKVRLRDTFTWNIHDRVIPTKLFAEQLVEDFKLPIDQCAPLVEQVYANIREQVNEFHPQIFIDEEPLDPHLPYNAYKNDEMRITIKLNITIGQHTLVDQFEWEINNPMNSPEDFARQMTLDLSLSGEFTTAIAHSIREQSQLFTRSLYVTGHPFDGRPVEDQELQAAFLPSPLPSPFRAHQAAKDFTPYLYELNESELEKAELSHSREERRQKRSVNRRGGPALPDLKDRRRTIRTLVVSSVLPGASEVMEDSRIFKRVAAVAGKRRPGAGNRDGLESSDESESEDSAPEEAIPSYLLAGTARTRGMRGAASAAQAAMRANLGRSATPEASIIHHHETRTSGRRRDYREESVDSAQPTYIVKLKIPREKYLQFLREQKLRANRPTSHARSPSGTPGLRTPARPGSMGPPSTTPRMQQLGLPQHSNPPTTPQPPSNSAAVSSQGQGETPQQIGRVDALGPPGHEFPIVRLYSILQPYSHFPSLQFSYQ